MKAKRHSPDSSQPGKNRLTRFTPLPASDTASGSPNSRATAPFADPEQRRAMIAEAAYYRAEKRGFEPGGDIEDWCAAENDIDSLLDRADSPTPCP